MSIPNQPTINKTILLSL